MSDVRASMRTKYDRGNLLHNVLIIFAVFLCIMSCTTVLKNDRDEEIEYPLESVYNSIPYVQQFDAFMKGQAELDVEPDPELAELENPYDPQQRAGISVLWDRAYYDGNYYSYFGIAPIFTVYFPYYIINGVLPTTVTVCFILAVFTMIFTALAYRELVLKFSPEANLWLMLLGLLAVLLGGGAWLGLSWPDNYYIAVLSAMQNSMAFIYFVLRAMRAKRVYAGALLFACAAVCAILTVWSRPTVAVMCLFMLPLVIEFFVRSLKSDVRSAAIHSASFFGLVAVGAVAVMWFNAIRFSSPFDFGADYQLTVSDVSKNKMDIALFSEAMVSFFIQSPTPVEKFPYVNVSYLTYTSMNKAVYVASTVGALHFGLPIAGVLAPIINGYKKNKIAFATFTAAVLLSVFVAFSDFCLAGVNLRYLLDILPILTLTSAISLLGLHERCEGVSRRLVTVIAVVMFAISVLTVYGIVKGNPEDMLFALKKL